MAIYCLGTSNFIVESSFYSEFRNSLQEDIINMSVGASPSATGMYFMSDATLAPGDVVLVDYAINDNSYVVNGCLGAERIAANLASVIATIVEQDAIPILMINPEAIGMRSSTDAQRMHEAVASATGVPLLNLAELFRQAVLLGADPALLMIDDAHQSPHLAPLIASVVKQAVRAVRLHPPTISLIALPTCSYRMIAAAPLVAPSRRVHRSSALRSAAMAALLEGESLNLAVAETEFVRGLMLNFGAAGGMVEVVGSRSRLVASLVTHWDNMNPLAFMSVFVEFKEPVQGGQSGVRIQVLPQCTEPTEPVLHRRLVHPELYGEVQIEGVLITTDRVVPEHPEQQVQVYDLLNGRFYDLATRLKAAVEMRLPMMATSTPE
jgi:hypothetical protein